MSGGSPRSACAGRGKVCAPRRRGPAAAAAWHPAAVQRDPRLRGLSSEHHQALVLARELATAPPEQGIAALLARFDVELEPHFRVEEELLAPALRACGEEALVARLEADHAFVREHVAAWRRGERGGATEVGARLREHVRFEERELFPRCEERLAPAILAEVARRCPAP